MKLRCIPEDFVVEELSTVVPACQGKFALYALEKRGLGTPEAAAAICRRWKLPSRWLSWGGLKDRHALTRQFITISHGPRRGLEQSHLSLHYLGQTDRPFTPSLVTGNRFHIVLRDLSEAAVQKAADVVKEIRSDGVANYFDDQRFGSVGVGRNFIARRLIDGDYEAALKLALIEPYEHDGKVAKQEKLLLRKHWGDWAAAKAALPKGHARSIVTYLIDHPADFRGAVARLRQQLLSLYLAAYQSYLWNKMLKLWIIHNTRPEQRLEVRLQLGRVPMPLWLDSYQREAFQSLKLPLPSSRLQLADDDPRRELIDEVMRAEKLPLAGMKLRHFRRPYFAKGDRAACFIPAHLSAAWAADDLHAGQQKLTLAFELPRGCYATMLVKRIAASFSAARRRTV